MNRFEESLKALEMLDENGAISLKGGYAMDYKITDKAAFTVLAASKVFDYEMQNRRFLHSGRSTTLLAEGTMCAECLESTSTRRWEMSTLNI